MLLLLQWPGAPAFTGFSAISFTSTVVPGDRAFDRQGVYFF